MNRRLRGAHRGRASHRAGRRANDRLNGAASGTPGANGGKGLPLPVVPLRQVHGRSGAPVVVKAWMVADSELAVCRRIRGRTRPARVLPRSRSRIGGSESADHHDESLGVGGCPRPASGPATRGALQTGQRLRSRPVRRRKSVRQSSAAVVLAAPGSTDPAAGSARGVGWGDFARRLRAVTSLPFTLPGARSP